MSQPQKYEKTTTFANLKNVTQAFPQIDKELNNVATSINEIRDNLRIIQRDDGDVIITKNVEDALMQMAKDGVDTYGASISASANNANVTANNAVVIANNAYNKADTAENTAKNAVSTANESASVVLETVASIGQTQQEVDIAIANLPSDISGEVSAQTANIPTLIQQAVDAAVVEKSGVTEESITTALGYKPASPASVTAEETARQTADSALQGNITALDNSLATVAKTGVYSDLTGKPTLATVATSGSYDDLSDKPSIPNVPTNVSAFTNDAGYLTQHQSLADYAKTSQLASYLPRSGGTMTGAITFASTQTFPSDDSKLDKSGGTTTGTVIFSNESGDAYGFQCAQGTHSVSFGISGAGNRGIFDGESNNWLIYHDTSGELRSDGKYVEIINASGSDYIRYENGIQTCWGVVDINSSTQTTITYPVQFLAGSGTDYKYGVSCAVNNRANFYLTPNVNGKTAVAMTSNTGGQRMFWVATGRWK